MNIDINRVNRKNIAHTALITGASSGIGKSFAKLLAEQGLNLVLTARRKERLNELADELSKKHGIITHVIVADLSDPKSPKKIYDHLKRKKISIDILVNNAGYGMPNMFRYSDWVKHREFLEVLVISSTHLVHLFEKDMLKKGFGRIINIASIAGIMPSVAGHTLYGAAKSYLIRFTQSHAHELAKHNITVTAICPGFTYSEFHDVSATKARVEQMPKFMWMTSDEVARQGYSAAMMGKVIFIPGFVNKLIVFAAKYLPEWLSYKLVKSNLNKFRSLEPEDNKKASNVTT